MQKRGSVDIFTSLLEVSEDNYHNNPFGFLKKLTEHSMVFANHDVALDFITKGIETGDLKKGDNYLLINAFNLPHCKKSIII